MDVHDRKFFIGVGRAFGGAILFSLPLLMTMEMWWLGFYMERTRLALFVAFIVPVLIGIDHYSGFKETASWYEDVEDGFVAFVVGAVAAASILALMRVIGPGMPLDEIVGKVTLQAVPAGFGAVLANSQLAGGDEAQANRKERQRLQRAGYPAELFFMLTGAVFLAFNVAPTEEMVLLAYMMDPLHAIALLTASLLVMHAFVYGASFRGAPGRDPGTSGWSLFLRYTVVGYAICLLVSAYVLWTFGRFEDHAFITYAMMCVVLAFPASIGAAGARLIL